MIDWPTGETAAGRRAEGWVEGVLDRYEASSFEYTGVLNDLAKEQPAGNGRICEHTWRGQELW